MKTLHHGSITPQFQLLKHLYDQRPHMTWRQFTDSKEYRLLKRMLQVNPNMTWEQFQYRLQVFNDTLALRGRKVYA